MGRLEMSPIARASEMAQHIKKAMPANLIPHGRERGLAPVGCPLTSTHAAPQSHDTCSVKCHLEAKTGYFSSKTDWTHGDTHTHTEFLRPFG